MLIRLLPWNGLGKRLGKDDERLLWPEMLRAIQEIQPSWVVGENVLGLVNWNGGLVFNEVQADLEAEGYEVQSYVLPAVSVNAPHRRDRVWFVAKNTKCNGRLFGEFEQERAENGELRNIGTRNCDRVCEQENAGITPNSDSLRYRGRYNESFSNKPEEREMDSNEKGNGGSIWGEIERCSWIAPNFQSTREQRQCECKQREIQPNRRDCRKIQTDWQNFPTQSPICGGDDGLPRELDGITFSKWRNESIKAYGNAIVPQVVYQIFKAINEYEKNLH